MLLSIVATFSLFLSSYGVGRVTYNLFRVNVPFLNHYIIHIIYGLIFFGILLFFTGFSGVLFSNYIIVLLFISAVISIFFISKDLYYNKKIILDIFKFYSSLDLFDKILLFTLIIFFLLNLFQVFAPPINDDSLAYHYTIPKAYLDRNSIFYDPFVPFNTPHLTELISIIPMKLGGIVSVQFFYYVISILFFLLMYKFVKFYFDTKSALLASLLIVTTPKFTYISSSGIVEIFLAVVTILSIWIFIEIINHFKSKSFDFNADKIMIFYACAFLGAAASIKYYGLYSIIAISTIFLIYLVIYNQNKKVLILSLCIVIGLLFSFPFYLKNIIFTGNPVYPVMYDLFGGIDWSGQLSLTTEKFFSERKKIEINFVNFLLSPIYLFTDFTTISGRAGYGLMIILLVPYLFNLNLDKNRNFNFKFISFYILLIWVMWFLFSFHRDRHLFVVISLFSIILAYAVACNYEIEAKSTSEKFRKYLLIFIIIFSFVPNISANLLFNYKFINYFITGMDNEKFLNNYIPFHDDFSWINDNLSNDTKVINFIGNRQYLINKKQFYPSAAFQGFIDFSSVNDAKEIYKKLKENNYDYIITNTPQNISIKSLETIDIEYDLLKRYNLLQEQLISLYTTKVYQSEIKKLPTSRTLMMDDYSLRLYVYKLN